MKLVRANTFMTAFLSILLALSCATMLSGCSNEPASKEAQEASFPLDGVECELHPNIEPSFDIDKTNFFCYMNEDPNAPIQRFCIAVVPDYEQPPSIDFIMDDAGNPNLFPNYGRETFNKAHWKTTKELVEDGIIEMPNGKIDAHIKIGEDNSFYAYEINVYAVTEETVDGVWSKNRTDDYAPIMDYTYLFHARNNEIDLCNPIEAKIRWFIRGNLNDLYTITFDTFEYDWGDRTHPEIVDLIDSSRTFRYVGAINDWSDTQ